MSSKNGVAHGSNINLKVMNMKLVFYMLILHPVLMFEHKDLEKAQNDDWIAWNFKFVEKKNNILIDKCIRNLIEKLP